jgi:hypothetical protein
MKKKAKSPHVGSQPLITWNTLHDRRRFASAYLHDFSLIEMFEFKWKGLTEISSKVDLGDEAQKGHRETFMHNQDAP